MITITLNPFSYDISGQPDLEVETEQDYIKSRIRIREMIHNRIDGSFVVTNERISNWYTSLCDYSDVQIQHISPKSILVKKLGSSESVRFDFPFSEEEIIRLKLIEKAESSRPDKKLQTSRDVELWVLSAILGKCWEEESGNLNHFAEISEWFLNLPERKVPSELNDLVSRQEQVWCSSEVGKLYQWLFSNPQKNAFLCYIHKILLSYPHALRMQILREGNIQELPPVISKCMKQMPVINYGEPLREKRDFGAILERKWKGYLRSSLQKGGDSNRSKEVLRKSFEDAIGNALKCMSGSIAGEVNAILYFVKEHTEMVTKDMAKHIDVKFGRFSNRMKEMASMIPPKTPRDLDMRWDWEAIKDWAIKEYFPFARWATKMGKQKELLERHAISFGEWLYRAYPLLKNDLAPLNYGTWNTIQGHLSNSNKVLWLIVDNLNWYYVDDFTSAFKDQKIYLSQSPSARLSMLPSETRISKAALIGGKLPSQLVSSNYTKLFALYCKEHGIKSSRFISDQEFKDGGIDDSQLTVCIINKLDSSSHGGHFDLEDDIKDAIRRLARYLKGFIEKGELPTADLRIIVSTDHGSCCLPQKQKGIRKPKNSKEEERFKRYAFVKNALELEENWLFLDKEKFGLEENVAIVKGFGFVGPKRPTGMVHGGMTPEEVIIPHMEFALEPLEVKDLELSYAGEPIPLGVRQRRITLSVTNANNVAISNIAIDIPSHSLLLEIKRIPEQDYVSQDVELALPKAETDVDDNNIAHLRGRYVFTCRGEKRYRDIELQIMVRKILDRSKAAEKMFDLQ